MQLMFRGKNLLKYILSASLSCLLLGAVAVNADDAKMTQVQLIQWLVQLSGDTSSLPPNPTSADYVQWAMNQGINPTGGWKADNVLNRHVLADALVQYFNLGKAGKDPILILRREGINLPGNPNNSDISVSGWVEMVNIDGLQPRSVVVMKDKHSKNKPPTHKPPKNPGNPPPWGNAYGHFK